MLPDFLPPIDPKRIKEISAELGEDPERVSNNVKLLEEWVKYQLHLPQNYDRSILPSFLRGCNQNLDKAKKKIETFFISKDTQLDLCGGFNKSYNGDLTIRDQIEIAFLPELTPEGYRVTLMRQTSSDITLYTVEKQLRYFIMLAIMRLHHDVHQVAGDIIIADVRMTTAQHVAKFLCNMTRKCFELVLTALPIKLKQIYIITNMRAVVKGTEIIKQLLKEKIRNRIYVLKHYEELEIPLNCLPVDFGGNLKSIKEYSDWLYEYVNGSDFFEKLEKVKIIPPIPKHSTITFSNEDFGMNGSFRQLNLD